MRTVSDGGSGQALGQGSPRLSARVTEGGGGPPWAVWVQVSWRCPSESLRGSGHMMCCPQANLQPGGAGEARPTDPRGQSDLPVTSRGARQAPFWQRRALPPDRSLFPPHAERSGFRTCRLCAMSTAWPSLPALSVAEQIGGDGFGTVSAEPGGALGPRGTRTRLL